MILFLAVALADTPEHLVTDAGAYWADPTGKLAELDAWAREEQADVLLLDAPTRVNLAARDSAPLIAYRAGPGPVFATSNLQHAKVVAHGLDSGAVEVLDISRSGVSVQRTGQEAHLSTLRRFDALGAAMVPGEQVRYRVLSGERVSDPVDIRYVNDDATRPRRLPEVKSTFRSPVRAPSSPGIHAETIVDEIHVSFRVTDEGRPVHVDLLSADLELSRVEAHIRDVGDELVGSAVVPRPTADGPSFVFVGDQQTLVDDGS